MLTKQAVIFIGIPATGKSTFYEHKFSESHIRVNLDTLKTRNKEQKLIENCIFEKSSMVIDNCNSKMSDRQRYMPMLKGNGYKVDCYYFKSHVNRCKTRNNQRTGKAKVPDVAILSHKKDQERPVFGEGFDRIFFVEIVPPKGDDNKPLFRIKELHKVFEEQYLKGEIEFWEDFLS